MSLCRRREGAAEQTLASPEEKLEELEGHLVVAVALGAHAHDLPVLVDDALALPLDLVVPNKLREG